MIKRTFSAADKVERPIFEKTPSQDLPHPQNKQATNKIAATTIVAKRNTDVPRAKSKDNAMNSFHTKLVKKGILLSPEEIMHDHHQDTQSDSSLSDCDMESETDQEMEDIQPHLPRHQQNIRNALYEIADVSSCYPVNTRVYSKSCRLLNRRNLIRLIHFARNMSLFLTV